MSEKISRGIIRWFIIIMICQCFAIIFSTPRSTDLEHKSFREKSITNFLASALFIETEEEKSEEEGAKGIAVQLADFSKNISFLSKVHTPHHQFVVYESRDDHQPSLFKLFCVFVI